MTKDKTITISRELAEDRVRFEKWHNEFYGPQDKFNPIRSLAHDSFSVGLGYDDPTVQAKFCAFRGAIAAPVVERQPVAWLDEESGAIVTDQLKALLDDGAFGIPLYRSPPAPVAVPVEIHQQLIEMRQQYERANFVTLGKMLNACLDKVKELNQ